MKLVLALDVPESDHEAVRNLVVAGDDLLLADYLETACYNGFRPTARIEE
jgi:hypothetical protein